ncbi:MAG TPA: NADH-ubiquinone oxidoreductase-F iron-sulfur binding region domain-containing protein [Negativicutes bacterium]|jgi:NADH-quinone oxidoreductase subunit F|nr:NADH-ubiquinone oxidoreductase-F iron-sulfur binding region domain-containing protein [Negativicutes bacterium]
MIVPEASLSTHRILVCCGTGCLANGAWEVYQALRSNLQGQPASVHPVREAAATGCHGLCSRGPFVRILPEDIVYCQVQAGDVAEIVAATLEGGPPVKRLLFRDIQTRQVLTRPGDFPFYRQQHKIVLRNVGEIDPTSLPDYLARGGYRALEKALLMEPDDIINEVISAGLRGRGGGGFPTGAKWRACAQASGTPRYIICNGDEGDPGAFMDESVMEGDPHSVLEGMIIGARAVNASQGFIYVRDEYARSIICLQKALEDAHSAGFLGHRILNRDFSFDIELVRGGGAFVCGEETALMASIEGNIGEPRDKYRYPTESGLWGQPTVINNVETWANIPYILDKGAAHFASLGTAGSKGTKVFSVVGKAVHTGLVEVPMGTSLRRIIADIAGGVSRGRRLKAVQTGGPSGGCIPEAMLDLEVDFDSLTGAGSMMGSGGIIVMDDRTCMVEVARYYMNFLAGESCGKCLPCREGIDYLLGILTRICHGRGEAADLERLQDVCATLQTASLCGLGKTAPNPVLSTLKYFREEYLAHIVEHRCPAGICRDLTTFSIDPGICNGCTLCLKSCPVEAIEGVAKQVHVIDQNRCIHCGECFEQCRQDAVVIGGR